MKHAWSYPVFVLGILTSFFFLSCGKPFSPQYLNPLDPHSTAYVPTGPADLTATLVNDTLSLLKWKDQSLGEQGFKLYLSSGGDSVYKLIAVLDSNTTSFRDTTVKSCDTLYTYRLYAYSGKKLSKTYTQAKSRFSFEAPQLTTVTGTDSTQAIVVWHTSTPFPTESMVERRDTAGFKVVGIFSPGVTTWADRSVSKYYNYQYRIASATRHNMSPFSRTWNADYRPFKIRSYAQIPTREGAMCSIEVSRNGEYALCRTTGNDMEILDLKNKVPLRTFAFTVKQPNAALSGNGQVLGIALRDSGEFCLYSTGDGHLIRTIKVKPPAVDLVISNDGSTLITSNSDDVVREWDIASGTLIRSLNGNTSNPISLALTPDGKTLITGSGSSLMYWDWQSGTLLKTTEGQYFDKPISIMQDGDVYNVRYDDTGAHVWDISRDKLIFTAPLQGTIGATSTITSDGLTLIAGGYGSYFVYSLVTGKLVGQGDGEIVAGLDGYSTFIAAPRSTDAPCTFFKIYYRWMPSS